MCVGMLPAYVSVQSLRKPEGGTRFPVTGFTISRELPLGSDQTWLLYKSS